MQESFLESKSPEIFSIQKRLFEKALFFGMLVLEKMRRLGMAASWDSCGGVKQKSLRKSKIPAGYASFIHDCSATAEQCRLVKVLQSNACIHDCRYCVNSSCRQRKVELEPEEIARAFNAFARQGIAQGLFLSSGVSGNAERATGKVIESARLLRQRFNFQGYVHLKVLPTTPKEQVFELAEYADRLSLNLEVPSGSYFQGLGSTKDYAVDLERRLRWIDEAKRKGLVKSFTTQLILGAAGETDADVLGRMNSLYRETSLHRTYFSAFQPIKGTGLEKADAERPAREHQLYQADWLLRKYGFRLREIKLGLDEGGNFGLARDVKLEVAKNNPGLFPVDVSHATLEELLRVPGIGPVGAERVLRLRARERLLGFKDLRKAGVIVKRTQGFIQVEGQRQSRVLEFC
jgi:predicted DNA-binding helix-hairpin-helix protein